MRHGVATLVFASMGTDEVVRLHERAEEWSGINFQILYLPLIVVAAAGWTDLYGGAGTTVSSPACG